MMQEFFGFKVQVLACRIEGFVKMMSRATNGRAQYRTNLYRNFLFGGLSKRDPILLQAPI